MTLQYWAAFVTGGGVALLIVVVVLWYRGPQENQS